MAKSEVPPVIKAVVIWVLGSTAVGFIGARLALDSLGHAASLVLYGAWFFGAVGLIIHIATLRDSTSDEKQ